MRASYDRLTDRKAPVPDPTHTREEPRSSHGKKRSNSFSNHLQAARLARSGPSTVSSAETLNRLCRIYGVFGLGPSVLSEMRFLSTLSMTLADLSLGRTGTNNMPRAELSFHQFP